MDIQSPEENGIQFTKKIKSNHPDISIIILTNYDTSEYRGAALQYGASDFIPKDYMSFEKLGTVVKSIMSDE